MNLISYLDIIEKQCNSQQTAFNPQDICYQTTTSVLSTPLVSHDSIQKLKQLYENTAFKPGVADVTFEVLYL